MAKFINLETVDGIPTTINIDYIIVITGAQSTTIVQLANPASNGVQSLIDKRGYDDFMKWFNKQIWGF